MADLPENAGSSRRCAIAGMLCVAAAPALAACGAAPTKSATGGSSQGSGSPSASPSAGSGGSGSGGGTTLGAASEIPVGGGKVFQAQQVVVTQPTKGSFHAFSAVCTHQGCLVSGVQDGKIVCLCHGSAFSATTGAVVSPPAPAPLAKKPLKVTGGKLVLG